VVATAGAYFHYNPPYGDVFMEVAEPYKRRGYGRYLVQEVKRICREMGRQPVTRCNVSNIASRQTLQKAGFLPCARSANRAGGPRNSKEEFRHGVWNVSLASSEGKGRTP